jgi:hypothetical protein
MAAYLEFVRRRNSDSTVDLICTKCFEPWRQWTMKQKLTSAETIHRCNPANSHVSTDDEKKSQSTGRLFFFTAIVKTNERTAASHTRASSCGL